MSADSLREAVEHRRESGEDQNVIDQIGDLRLRHAIAELALNRLSILLRPNNGIEIVAVLGSSGVGKTTLFTSDYRKELVDRFNKSGGIIHFEPPQLGQVKIMVKAFLWMALQAGNEPMLDNKIQFEVKDGKLNVVNGTKGGPNTLALRNSLVSMLDNRDVLAMVVDEVMHLLRVRNSDVALDMIKGFAKERCPKVIVIGDMNFPGRTAAYEQFMRRGRAIYVPRYDHILEKTGDSLRRKKICKDALDAFSEILEKYEYKWPFRNVPEFRRNKRKLLVESLGTIGILRQIVIGCLEYQIAAGGGWKSDYFDSNFLPSPQRENLESSYLSGDAIMRRYGWEGGMSINAVLPGEKS